MGDAPRKSHGRVSIAASAQPRPLMEGPPRLAGAWTAKVVTLFPEAFPGPLDLSLVGRAREAGVWALETVELRRFGIGRHRSVDDTPTGGGAGMVLRPDVLADAITAAAPGPGMPILALSPRGRRFDQAMATRLAAGPGAVMICGRFEGIDERVLEEFGVIEVSLGDFVLTGGEIAAMALIDATVRLIPRVLGNQESIAEESFSDGLLEHPQYTRPAVWRGRAVPDILLSGHHANIAAWRRAEAERLTKERRPDLWRARRTDGGDPGGDREL